MTREFQVLLPSSAVTYNMWDLIKPTDPTMSNSPYTPNLVKKLKMYFPVAGSASVNNGGANISIVNAGGQELRNMITGDSFDLDNVDLTRFRLKGSANNVQVSIVIGF